MKYPNNITQTIWIGYHQLKDVSTFKLPGVKVRYGLKWNDHIDYIYSKAAKPLYILRVLQRAGVAGSNIVNIYKCSVRSILEYAVPSWQDIPENLSLKLESIQNKPLRLFSQTIVMKKLWPSLALRVLKRTTCHKSAWRLNVCHEVISVPWDLRSLHEKSFHPYIRTERTNDFSAFKFLD